MKRKDLEKIFNASDEELKEWEKYEEGIKPDEVLKEILAERVLKAIDNIPVIKIPLAHTKSPMNLCLRRAASSKEDCQYQDSAHYQFIEEDEVKIQVPLSNPTPISCAKISFIDNEGREEKISVEIEQDEDEIFVNCGNINFLKKKVGDILRKYSITIDDITDVNLEIYQEN